MQNFTAYKKMENTLARDIRCSCIKDGTVNKSKALNVLIRGGFEIGNTCSAPRIFCLNVLKNKRVITTMSKLIVMLHQ